MTGGSKEEGVHATYALQLKAITDKGDEAWLEENLRETDDAPVSGRKPLVSPLPIASQA